jgi:acyl carrier protein
MEDTLYYKQLKNLYMELEKQIIKIIAESLEVSEDQITEDTAIGDIPEWNSLGHIVIISSLEKEFSINFDPEIIMDLEDVSDIVGAIDERLKNS